METPLAFPRAVFDEKVELSAGIPHVRERFVPGRIPFDEGDGHVRDDTKHLRGKYYRSTAVDVCLFVGAGVFVCLLRVSGAVCVCGWRLFVLFVGGCWWLCLVLSWLDVGVTAVLIGVKCCDPELLVHVPWAPLCFGILAGVWPSPIDRSIRLPRLFVGKGKCSTAVTVAPLVTAVAFFFSHATPAHHPPRTRTRTHLI